MQLLKARACPDDIPRLTREHFARRFDRRLEWTDDSFRVFNFDCLFPQYVNEWAVPLERAPAALRALQRWVDDEGARPGGARVHFPVEIRFVQRNSVWLSPAYDQDVCYIGVIMYRPFHWPVPYKRYWKAYEDIMRLHHGRPHWAKAHQMFYHDFVDCYPKFADFVQLRRDCDPQNIFVNDYLRRHLLPPDELLPSDSRIATDHAHLRQQQRRQQQQQKAANLKRKRDTSTPAAPPQQPPKPRGVNSYFAKSSVDPAAKALAQKIRSTASPFAASLRVLKDNPFDIISDEVVNGLHIYSSQESSTIAAAEDSDEGHVVVNANFSDSEDDDAAESDYERELNENDPSLYKLNFVVEQPEMMQIDEEVTLNVPPPANS
ncbi:D-arabinono-1,4-lactone oxidase, partial [Coemansia sp. RSA 475]